MRTVIVLTGVLLLGVAGIGGAGHGCNGVITELPGGIYIDDRDFFEGGLWVYQESNGMPGLQTGGIGPLDGPGTATGLFSQADGCAHANPDTLIF